MDITKIQKKNSFGCDLDDSSRKATENCLTRFKLVLYIFTTGINIFIEVYQNLKYGKKAIDENFHMSYQIFYFYAFYYLLLSVIGLFKLCFTSPSLVRSLEYFLVFTYFKFLWIFCIFSMLFHWFAFLFEEEVLMSLDLFMIQIYISIVCQIILMIDFIFNQHYCGTPSSRVDVSVIFGILIILTIIILYAKYVLFLIPYTVILRIDINLLILLEILSIIILLALYEVYLNINEKNYLRKLKFSLRNTLPRKNTANSSILLGQDDRDDRLLTIDAKIDQIEVDRKISAITKITNFDI